MAVLQKSPSTSKNPPQHPVARVCYSAYISNPCQVRILTVTQSGCSLKHTPIGLVQERLFLGEAKPTLA